MEMATALDFSAQHLIRNEAEYDAAVSEMDRLLDENPREGSRAEERIEFLSLLIEAYDRKHHAFVGDDVTPPQIVEFMLNQRGMSRGDVVPALGSKSRVSEFFSGKRPLSITQILKLRAMFGISADLLIGRPAER